MVWVCVVPITVMVSLCFLQLPVCGGGWGGERELLALISTVTLMATFFCLLFIGHGLSLQKVNSHCFYGNQLLQ